MELVEKEQILTIDLCARLPYGVMCHISQHNGGDLETDDVLIDMNHEGVCEFKKTIGFSFGMFIVVDEVKPYLRPLSTMTEEEYKEYEELILNEKDEKIKFCNSMRFYNSKHFDYRGLIDMGLALPAPERMYNN